MAMTEERLLKMKSTIEEKRQERGKLEGRKQQLVDQLKADFEVSSVEEAKALIDRLEEEIGEADRRLKQLVSEIEGRYEQLRQ